MSSEEQIEETLCKGLGEYIVKILRPRKNRLDLTSRKEGIQQAIKLLVENYDARLMTISAVDEGLDIELIYHMSIKDIVINVKTKFPKEEPKISTVTNIIPGANWIEREIMDLFGITFEGHPDPRRLVLTPEWPKEKTPLKGPLRGVVTPFQKPTVEALLNQGQLFPILGVTKKQRAELKMPETPPTTLVNAEALADVQKIAKAVKFDEKVGFDWKRKKLRYG
ncbi:NADH-quinone oxidoreductase subunit C [Candidatus Bathyarchaeota archaeon]|nr:NADH-quinone oxidoreductase subunit C [Candidatus Bathyarchaeota archaeon]